MHVYAHAAPIDLAGPEMDQLDGDLRKAALFRCLVQRHQRLHRLGDSACWSHRPDFVRHRHDARQTGYVTDGRRKDSGGTIRGNRAYPRAVAFRRLGPRTEAIRSMAATGPNRRRRHREP